jgi:hypothetical protein
VALGTDSITFTKHRDDDFSLLSTVFAEWPIKSTRQRSHCRYTVRRAFFDFVKAADSGSEPNKSLIRARQGTQLF